MSDSSSLCELEEVCDDFARSVESSREMKDRLRRCFKELDKRPDQRFVQRSIPDTVGDENEIERRGNPAKSRSQYIVVAKKRESSLAKVLSRLSEAMTDDLDSRAIT